MTKPILTAVFMLVMGLAANAQPCTPLGDQVTYGTNDTWIGYVYDDIARTTYMGYVNEGTPGNPNFDESFGGANVSYPTHGCAVNTNTFGVRYKLQKTFAAATYVITVGGDDGYRLSLDGGATWAIDRYSDQSYIATVLTVALSGPVSMVLEYYENGSDNRVSFSVAVGCSGTEDQTISGTSNSWYGYIYDGTAFNTYVGRIQEGTVGNANFDESFGGSNISYNTSGCSVQTETFSARYRLQKTFVNKSVTFTVGGDDGFRLSIDGGATWLITRWVAQSYTTASATVTMNGTYNLVLEYYENSGDNRISFSSVENIILPLRLVSFTGTKSPAGIRLEWKIFTDNETLTAQPQRSTDGFNFTSLSGLVVPSPIPVTWTAGFTDDKPVSGKSYYRLRLQGADGQVSYSNVLAFSGTGPASDGIPVRIYPTIADRQSSLSVAASKRLYKVTVTIHDATGRMAGQEQLGAMDEGQVSGIMLQKYGLKTGLHFVTISDASGFSATSKLLIR